MKKYVFTMITGFLMIGLLAGCNLTNDNNKEADSGSSSSKVAQSTASTAKSTSSKVSSSTSAASQSSSAARASNSAAGAETVSESESVSEAEQASLEEDVAAAEASVVEAPAASLNFIDPGYGDWYIENGVWYQTSNPSNQRQVGDSALIVSISNQTLWAILDNQIFIETPITTGKPGEETPTGFYNIQHKESPSVLIGADYAAPVTYWMPFIGNSHGFHDATWQSEFGGDRYVSGFGSRGCINLPYGVAESLYYNYQAGEEVIILL